MTLNEPLLEGNLIHILVLCCFVIFVLILPFKKSCFLVGILAQASPFSLRRVERRKVGCSLESSRLSEFDTEK